MEKRGAETSFPNGALFSSKKGAMQMSFAWIFAIIVGVFILALAIFAVAKFTKTEQLSTQAETSKTIGVLLNPLETSFETGKTTSLFSSVETRIYNDCKSDEEFGEQLIKTISKSFDEWAESGINVKFSNKYIFSEDFVQGKTFYVFSKPFEFPFKVSDLIFLTSSEDNYCFIGAPDEIEEELEDLKQANLFVKNCPENSINVCFGSGNCDIKVSYNGKSVEKNGKKIYFEGDALMYAGIFSDADIYECQVKRLMERTKQLSNLYFDKESFISQKAGCTLDVSSNLIALENLAGSLEDSEDLVYVKSMAEQVEKKNENAGCKLW